MISEIPSQSFSALPVRRRETLEIFDTALKLYRRYFWVLMGWSALVSVTSLTAIFASFLYLFISPLLYGAVSCCVAAAVRGQAVRFRQCWDFTKPRYAAMLGALLLSWLVMGCAIVVFYFAAALIGVAGIFALSNAPEPVVIVCSIIGIVALLAFFSALGVFMFGWLTMVPIVSCLEDDKRGVAAMGRALELLKGNWRRVFGMSLIIGLAMLAVFGIVGGAYWLIAGVASIKELFGDSSDSAIWALVMTYTAFMAIFLFFWNPAQMLIIAVLYLDLRVRREALDLEWTAYASAPPVSSGPGAVALETPTPGARASSALPPDLAFSGLNESPTSLAAGTVELPPSPVAPPDFSEASFSPPTAPSNPPADVLPAEPSPVPVTIPVPPRVEEASLFNPPPASGISLNKDPESEIPPAAQPTSENEGRREL